MTPFSMKTLAVVFVAGLIGVLAGCSNADDPVQINGGTIQSEVQATAPAAALAAESAPGTADTVVQVMNLLTAAAASSADGVSPALGPVTCPAEFTLDNGVSGTCQVDDAGVVHVTFSGVVDPIGPVEVSGTLVSTPSGSQPSSGGRYDIVLDATVSGPNSTIDIDATGSVTLDELVTVIDHNLNIVVVIHRTPGPNVTVTTTISSGQYTVSVAGPLGNTVSLSLDRETRTGSILVNGQVVGTVAVEGDCLVIDFNDPTLNDGTLCAD